MPPRPPRRAAMPGTPTRVSRLKDNSRVRRAGPAESRSDNQAQPEAGVPTKRWLNRNVMAISVSALLADANYEMVLSVLHLFLILGLGAPVYALGLVEGVSDGCSAAFKFASGYYSDRMKARKPLAAAGYAVTAASLGLLTVVTTWPQVLASRAAAWIGKGSRQPIRSA